MKGRSSLFALSALALALACENSQQPTGLRAPTDASKIISDGANGGNQDFFFLPPLVPPLVPLPAGFDPGEFNDAIGPSLTVEICRLKPEKLDKQRLPTAATPCYKNGPRDKFGPGTVQLLPYPAIGMGWWRTPGLDLPAEPLYYVLWDTREAHLNAEKFYRVKVFLDGLSTPLGVIDIDPLKRLRDFRPSKVGKVVQVLDDVLLPIPFRVENGALCGGASECTSETVDNEGGTVTVDAGGGATIAGANFPEGWLPEGGPQSVVVTIREVPSGEKEDGSRTRTIPCHLGLPFQQFNKCFQFTTIPVLADITPGVQFAAEVTVAVCYALFGNEDFPWDYAELYASGPDETPHVLEEVSEFGLVSPNARDCTPSEGEPFGLESSNPLTRLASTGWRALKGGMTQLFGVKTAYAVDGGLGGIVKGFSNIGPALTAEIEAYPPTNPEADTTRLTLEGATVIARVSIVGSHSHDSDDDGYRAPSGINGVPVKFWVVGTGGTISHLDANEDSAQVTVITSTFQDEGSVDGVASVVWTPPTIPNVYTLKATGPTADTVTFTVTVPPAIGLAPNGRRMLSMQTGARLQLSVTSGTVLGWESSDPPKISVSQAGLVTALLGGENIAGGADASITSFLSNESPGPSLLVNSFSFDLFPRATTLVWKPALGAVSYEVVTEFGNASVTNPFCSVPADCGVWTIQSAGSTVTTGLSFTFDFVGSQPGRWRVFARNASGAIISTSAYVYFDYDI